MRFGALDQLGFGLAEPQAPSRPQPIGSIFGL
jgi:hypothetical protein